MCLHGQHEQYLPPWIEKSKYAQLGYKFFKQHRVLPKDFENEHHQRRFQLRSFWYLSILASQKWG
jgi:hypothetical protein